MYDNFISSSEVPPYCEIYQLQQPLLCPSWGLQLQLFSPPVPHTCQVFAHPFVDLTNKKKMYKKNQLEVNVPLSKLNPMQRMLIDSLDWMVYVQLRAGRGWLIFVCNMPHVRVAVAFSRLIMCLPSSNLRKSTSQKFFWVSKPGNSVIPVSVVFFFFWLNYSYNPYGIDF